jgi:hypothetical protein
VGEDHVGDAAEEGETAGLDAAPPGLEEGAGGRGAAEAPEGAQLLLQGPGEAGLELRVEEQLAQLQAPSPVEPLEAVEPELAGTLERRVSVALAEPMLGAADLVDGRVGVPDHVKRIVDDARLGQAGGDRCGECGPPIDADDLDGRPLPRFEGVGH